MQQTSNHRMEHESVLSITLKGAVAGVAAGWIMDRFDWFAFDHEDPKARRRTENVRPGGMDPAPALADKAAAAIFLLRYVSLDRNGMCAVLADFRRNAFGILATQAVICTTRSASMLSFLSPDEAWTVYPLPVFSMAFTDVFVRTSIPIVLNDSISQPTRSGSNCFSMGSPC
jgi:hypothetical protein